MESSVQGPRIVTRTYAYFIFLVESSGMAWMRTTRLQKHPEAKVSVGPIIKG